MKTVKEVEQLKEEIERLERDKSKNEGRLAELLEANPNLPKTKEEIDKEIRRLEKKEQEIKKEIETSLKEYEDTYGERFEEIASSIRRSIR